MVYCTDQLGRTIPINSPPKRIISVVPSQTELLYDLGADAEVVGITRFCIHPDHWFRTKTRVGGTKKIDLEKIKLLQPDLIICNKEENEREQIEKLMELYPVWVSDIKNLGDAVHMITSIGDLVDKKENAVKLVQKIKKEFKKLELNTPAVRTAYLIWNNPIMCAGADTFIDEMLGLCGFQNIFSDSDSRYPEVKLQELSRMNPSLILLSSEPFPFREKHIREFQQACPNANIKLVDGELFSWYGSRLQYAPEYLMNLLHSLSLS